MVGGNAVDVDDSVCVTVFVTGANFIARTVLEDVGTSLVVVDVDVVVVVVLFIEVVFVSAVVVDVDDTIDVDVDSTNVVSSFKQTSIKRNRRILHEQNIKSSFTNQ